jgi:glycosyltransferase involved in cell wall biosynthesis
VRGHYFLPVEVAGGAWWRRPVLSRSYRHVYRLFDRVIAVSASVAADLETRRGARVGAGRVEIIANGVDVEAVSRTAGQVIPSLPAARPLIVSVANFFPIKGHAVLIEAMSTVIERHPGAHLLLVGDGPERVRMEQVVARRGLVSHVTFAGSRADATACTAAADLVVLASSSEGMPRAILEALALAKPVVASAVGGVPELIVDRVTGRLTTPGEPAALAEAILAVLGNPGEALDMGRRGRQHVAERFSLRQAARRTEAVYEGLLAGVTRRLPSPGGS